MKNSKAFLLIAAALVSASSPSFAAITDSDRATIGVENFLINGGAENGAAGFASYADAAGTAPVDMTGGSPNTTCTATGTSPLAGSKSFLMTVTTGATRQGEGCRFSPVTIPLGKRGKTLTATFDYVTTGSMVDGDFTPYAYQIDGANPHVLTPSGYPTPSILGATGSSLITFTPDSDATQIRYGIHIGRASATGSVTIKLDSVKLQVPSASFGMAGSNVTSYTPTFVGFGTVTVSNISYMRVGGMLKVSGKFTPGTTTAVAASISLPTGLTSKSTIPSSAHGGTWFRDVVNASKGGAIITNPSATTVSFGPLDTFSGSSAGPLNTTNGSSLANSGEIISVTFEVPIEGWDSGWAGANSSGFWISSYLANGNRVSTTPAVFGEYRARYKSATGASGTLTDVAPTVAPTAADGLRIYGNVPGNSSGTTGQIAIYDIFVGKGLSPSAVGTQFFTSAGRTGQVETKFFTPTTTSAVGARTPYDPTSGVLTIDASFNWSSSETARYLGTALSGGSVTDGYVDAFIAKNALAVGMDSQQVISSSKNWRTESVSFGGASETSNCTADPCTVYRGTSAVSAVNFTSTGIYVVHFTSGTFSSPPICLPGSNQASGNIFTVAGAATTTAVTFNSRATPGGTLGNDSANVICMGPR